MAEELDSSVPEWFGRRMPGENLQPSAPVPASRVLSGPTDDLLALPITSWTWSDQLEICWPVPATVERVYFPAGAVEGGACLADIEYGSKGWLAQVGLFDLAMPVEAWADTALSSAWELSSWKVEGSQLYLLLAPASEAK
ncbi:hypothetical protein [Halomonas sp. I5-271120]|uniref:hypothetical protein n=1 Tax=Halomonas sp. I5-271120 TaxID=3061632 RepID=UPI002714F1EA|nr:hypothetical protein [Halomonas sp. I5-271120]